MIHPVTIMLHGDLDTRDLEEKLYRHLALLRREATIERYSGATVPAAEAVRFWVDIVVLFVSPGLFLDRYADVLWEAEAAFNRGIPVVPIRCVPVDLPADHWLRRCQTLPRAMKTGEDPTIGATGPEQDKHLAVVARELRAQVGRVKEKRGA
jgi:hypothetical protein